MGQPPKPTKLRRLQGNPGKRPLPENEPTPEPLAATPRPPNKIAPPARRIWRVLAPELTRLGLLTALDLNTFAGYCALVARWLEAEKEIRKLGLVVKSPSGYPIQNPYLSIANRALKQSNEIGAHLGLSPAARSRIDLEKLDDEDELEAFLRKTRKKTG